MARQPRLDAPDTWHHVMNRGARKEPIYRTASDAHDFLDLVDDASTRFGVEVHAYCLMGNHYHLLIRSVDGTLSRAMQHIDGVYTQRFNRRHRHDGPLLRGRFRSIIVDSERYLDAVAVYIHRNPLEAGLVRSLVEHEWSSYPTYLGHRRPEQWLHTSVLDARFPDVAGLRQLTERDPLSDEVERFYATRPLGPALGSPAFRAAAVHGVDPASEIEPDLHRLAAQESIESVIDAVASVFGVANDAIRHATPGRRNMARSVAIAVAADHLGLPLGVIAPAFGLARATSVSTARRVVSDQTDRTPELASKVDRVVDAVGGASNLRRSRSDPGAYGGQDWR